MKIERTTAPPFAVGGFEVVDRVRWGDVDRAGIIYFGAYARFIDVAESEFFRSLGFTYRSLDDAGVLLSRVHVEFDFFKPALLDDELVLRPRVSGVGVHSVRLKLAIYRKSDEALLAEAKLVAACINKSREPTPLPLPFADALRALITHS
jgi:acyl-CoA thioester hydrolase